jgi:hypothetical protein
LFHLAARVSPMGFKDHGLQTTVKMPHRTCHADLSAL